MRALDRKLLRDLMLVKGQAVTIGLVVACGIGVFVAALGTGASLVGSRARYYDQARFADVFATVERAPAALVARIAAIPGVADVEDRVVADVRLDVAGHDAPATGRLVSLPEGGAPRLNRIHLRRGRTIEPRHRDEVVVSEGFAAAHGLEPGAELAAVLNGRRQTLRVVGIGLSPEYVFPIQGGAPLPDDSSFGVLWIARSALAGTFDLEGAFNDVTLATAPGANPDAVIAQLDALLDPYGGRGAHGRDLQPSHRFLDDEIAEQRSIAATIPVVFLGVAAFLLNVTLGRIVTSQREQIATLKALGYADARIALHYLELAVIVVLGGTLAGCALGVWLGRLMTAQYTEFFRFPVLAFELEAWTPLLAALVAFAAGAGGAFSAVHGVLRLSPASAMRPPVPAGVRRSLPERLGLMGRPSPQTSMLLRGISSRPVRFAMTSIAVACATGVVVLGMFWHDALDYMVSVQFRLAERAHATVVFDRPMTARVVRELGRLAGVEDAEGYRAVAVTLRAGNRWYQTGLQGLSDDTRLRRLLDARLREVAPSGPGILLTRQLGERLGVAPGDTVRVEVREGERPQRDVVVQALVDDLIGLSAYMDLGALHALLGEGDTVNAAGLRLNAASAAAVYARLEQRGGIATVMVKESWLEVFRRTTARFVLFFTAILTVFAIVIAVGVVYNAARIALQERSWELASLRVLGFTRGEVSAILLAELAINLLIGVPLGLVLGYAAALGFSELHATDLFRIPVIVTARTCAYAVTPNY
ncbi:ABC transporter permease [Reyranella sp.]|uniref:ABC transporter permease n=1 Tax=Reyranella sp. TaxID=1929291 RepID=UPI003BAC09BB